MPKQKDFCQRGHDQSIHRTNYGTKRCGECVRIRVRNIKRQQLGIPLDTPVRVYVHKQKHHRPKQTLELIRLVSVNPEVAKSLLAIAKSWGVN